jgi:hypothetical protein
MTKFNPYSVSDVIKGKEPDIHELCQPYSGNCYEIALALYRIFSEHSVGFCSVYATADSDSGFLPLHLAVQIEGELFDAGGRLDKSHLIEEFAPENNDDLLEFEYTFQYEHVITDNILTKVMKQYKSAFNTEPK